jgi:hypothetical protein
MWAIAVSTVFGFLLGAGQSLAVGLYAGSWDGGTGLVWGFVVALPAGLAAVAVGWWGIAVAAALAVSVGAASALTVWRSA